MLPFHVVCSEVRMRVLLRADDDASHPAGDGHTPRRQAHLKYPHAKQRERTRAILLHVAKSSTQEHFVSMVTGCTTLYIIVTHEMN